MCVDPSGSLSISILLIMVGLNSLTTFGLTFLSNALTFDENTQCFKPNIKKALNKAFISTAFSAIETTLSIISPINGVLLSTVFSIAESICTDVMSNEPTYMVLSNLITSVTTSLLLDSIQIGGMWGNQKTYHKLTAIKNAYTNSKSVYKSIRKPAIKSFNILKRKLIKEAKNNIIDDSLISLTSFGIQKIETLVIEYYMETY